MLAAFRFLPSFFSSAILASGLWAGAGTASAATVGVAVDGVVTNNPVGMTEFRPLLGAQAIKYFIPLGKGANCVYGVDCGTLSDSGWGGREMSMFLRFDPVSTTGASELNILFEDLDLSGANDPAGFLESVRIFDGSGTALTGWITAIADPLVTGNADTQQLLSLGLGVLPATTFFAELRFNATSSFYGRNTPEYLVAEVAPVPLPPSLLFFGTALAGLALQSRRAKKAA